ncbi:MAG: right-handed parallel beta-helix repeat-containing protein [Candidatus Omnitrophica bacterium]|nr:right-handed parallel beta-helix repeat-containing protein [Candidatus Omnitrophota bacterium]
MNKKGFTLLEMVCASIAFGLIALAVGAFFVYNVRVIDNVQRYNERKFMSRAVRDAFRNQVLASAFIEADPTDPIITGTDGNHYGNSILLHSHSNGGIRRYRYVPMNATDNPSPDQGKLFYSDSILDSAGMPLTDSNEIVLLEDIMLPEGHPGIFRFPKPDDVFQEPGSGGYTSYRSGFRTNIITLFDGVTKYYPSVEISFYPRPLSGEEKDKEDNVVLNTIVGARESMTAMFIDEDGAEGKYYQDGTRIFPFKNINDYLTKGSLDCRAYVISGVHTLSTSLGGGQIGDRSYYLYFMPGSTLIFPSTDTPIKIKGIYVYGDVEFNFNPDNPCILEGQEYLDYNKVKRRTGGIYIYDQNIANMEIAGLETHKVSLYVQNQGNTINFHDNNTYGYINLYGKDVILDKNFFRGGSGYAAPIAYNAGATIGTFSAYSSMPNYNNSAGDSLPYKDNYDGTVYTSVYISAENIKAENNAFRGVSYFSGSASGQNGKVEFNNNSFSSETSGSIYLYGKIIDVLQNPLIAGGSGWGGSVRVTPSGGGDTPSIINVENNKIYNMTNGVYLSLSPSIGDSSQISVKNNNFYMGTQYYSTGSSNVYTYNSDGTKTLNYVYNYRTLSNGDAAINVYFGSNTFYQYNSNYSNYTTTIADYKNAIISIEGNTIDGYNKTETGITVRGAEGFVSDKSPTLLIANNYIKNIRGTTVMPDNIYQTIAGDNPATDAIETSYSSLLRTEDMPRCEYYQKYKEAGILASDGEPYEGYSLGGPDAAIFINGGNVRLENNIVENSGYNNTSVLIADDYASNVIMKNNQFEKVIVRSNIYSQELLSSSSYDYYTAQSALSANLNITMDNVILTKNFWVDPAIANSDLNNKDISITASIFEGGVSQIIADNARNSYIRSVIDAYVPEVVTSSGSVSSPEQWTYVNYAAEETNANSDDKHFNRGYFLEPVYVNATDPVTRKTYKKLQSFAISNDASKVTSYQQNEGGGYTVVLSNGEQLTLDPLVLTVNGITKEGALLQIDPSITTIGKE